MAVKSKKKLATNILFYSVAIFLYAYIAYELACKFTGNQVYLFGNRYDVVLTDSMSEKNENHLDFLEGTSQIQAFDLVGSSKITDDTELKVKDIVLFTNPDLNNKTDMHRIVNIIEKGDQVNFLNVNLKDYDNKKGIEFIDYGSCISTSSLNIKKFSITFLSDKPYNSNFLLNVGTSYVEATTYTSQILESGIYEHKMIYERSTTYPVKLVVRSANISFTSILTNLDIECDADRYVNVKATDYIPTEEKSNSKLYNVYYLYETRGDKAKDSDGIFERSALISKVHTVIPKLGYVVRFLTSIPGMILIIGLALIITIFAYLYNKPEKPKKVKEGETAEIIENADKNKEEKKDDKDEKK